MKAEWSSDEGSGEELARRAAQIELQPPPPGARARVWQVIERRRARAAWRLALPMFLAGAATAALVLFVALAHRAERATVLFSDGSQRLIKSGERLPSSPELALVDLQGAGRMVTGAGSEARLDRFDGGAVELSLNHGTLLLHVNPRAGGQPFVVRTPGFVARVVGTVLRVVVSGSGHASIAVGHGTVEVTPVGGTPRLVHAGERWPADARELPGAAELERLGPANLEGATFAPPVAAAPAPPAIDDAHREGAMYQAGWQKLKLGDVRGGLAIWQEQRARFPHGLLEHEVHASIIDALVALREDRRARAEVDDYLRETPDGLRSSEMHFVRGTLLVAADRSCRRAAGEFDRALQRPAAPWAEQARAARAACKKR